MDEIKKKRKWPKVLLKSGLLVAFGLGFFVFGWLTGNGRVVIFGPNIKTENASLPKDLDYSSVEQVYDELKANYDGKLDEQTLLDGLKSGLASATKDPYTEYFNKDEAKDFGNELNGTFEGIGAELSKQDNNIVIVSPIKGFPADKAGIKAKDIITEINGESAANLSVTEAVNKIRGEAGTKVKLTVVRDRKEELTFDITREKITLPSVKHEMLADKIGYIEISRFAEDTASLTKQAAEDLKNQGAKGIILDLRGDPGGLLTAAVDVSSLWVDKGKTVLDERRGDVTINTHAAKGGNTLKGIPTVVLIDGGSASASEITAGALADQGAATLMGVKSFGKGSVQELESIPSGGLLKVTIARWYTPGGRNIDKQGIEPKIVVKLDEKQATRGKDNQKQAAINYLLKQ